MSVFERLKQYKELYKKKLELEEQLKPIKKELGAVEFQALQEMQKQGTKSLNVDGVTFYRKAEFFAKTKKGISRDQLMAVLSKFGMNDLLQLSTQTVRAKMKEAADGGQTMPPELLTVLDCGSTERLRVNGMRSSIEAEEQETEGTPW